MAVITPTILLDTDIHKAAINHKCGERPHFYLTEGQSFSFYANTDPSLGVITPAGDDFPIATIQNLFCLDCNTSVYGGLYKFTGFAESALGGFVVLANHRDGCESFNSEGLFDSYTCICDYIKEG